MRISLLLALLTLGCSEGGETPAPPVDAQKRQEAIGWSNRGSLFLREGRPDRAIEMLAKAIRLDSTASAAHFNKGLAHARLQQHPAATAAFERALAIEPDKPNFLFGLASSLRSQHRYLEAAGYLERAIAQQPDRAEYHFNLGQVRRATSDFAGARTAFARTLELAPDHIDARYLLSDLLAREQELTAARRGFTALLDLDPTHFQGLLGLGGLLVKLNEAKSAIAILERASAVEPHDPGPHYLLAQAYEKSARPQDAAKARERFQRLGTAERHLNQGKIYLRRREWAKAAAELNRALQNDSTSVAIRLQLAQLHAQQQRSEQSIALLTEAVGLAPDHLEAHLALGEQQLRDKSYGAAARSFTRAREIAPHSFAAAYGLGKARWQKGDLAGAVEALRQSLALDPDHRDAHYALGLVYVRLERFADARTSFTHSTGLDSTHVESHYGLALLDMQQGRKATARQRLQKVLALHPEHQRARAKLNALDAQP